MSKQDYKPCGCVGIITDSIRKKLFEGIFPNDEIPLRHPLVDGRAQTGNEEYTFYHVDKNALTEAQKEMIAERLSPIFNLPKDEILKDFDNPDFKVPLKSDGVIVSWCPRHFRAAL